MFEKLTPRTYGILIVQKYTWKRIPKLFEISNLCPLSSLFLIIAILRSEFLKPHTHPQQSG